MPLGLRLGTSLPNELKDTRHLDEKSRYDLLSSVLPDFIISRENPLVWQNELRYPYFRRIMGRVEGRQVVDLACGWGFLAQNFADDGAIVTGYDISSRALHLAGRRSAEYHHPIRFTRGRSEALPFSSGIFDIVTATDMLEHVDSVETTLAEAARILKPGGFFGFVTVNKTILARLIYITFGEDLLGLLPKGTHCYHKFVPPQDLIAAMARHGLDLVDLRGILVNPIFKRYHFWPSLSIEYAGVAKKIPESHIPNPES